MQLMVYPVCLVPYSMADNRNLFSNQLYWVLESQSKTELKTPPTWIQAGICCLEEFLCWVHLLHHTGEYVETILKTCLHFHLWRESVWSLFQYELRG